VTSQLSYRPSQHRVFSECHRFDADPLQHCLQSEAVQDARSVGANIDAGTDLSEGRCLLVDLHIESRPQSGQRRGKSANAAANDRRPTTAGV